ncbi:MAG TPA: SRPBCC family protein [Planctomycetota bacterium]
MKILKIVGSIVILLALATVGLGLLRPKDHVASVRTDFAAAPEQVWALIADLQSWPEWNSDIESVTRGDDRDGHPFWIMGSSFGEMSMWIEVDQEGRRMRTVIPPDNPGFHGTWTYLLEPREDGGCTLTLTETGTTTNILYRAMSTFMDEYAGLVNVAATAGTKLGEKVVPAIVET